MSSVGPQIKRLAASRKSTNSAMRGDSWAGMFGVQRAAMPTFSRKFRRQIQACTDVECLDMHRRSLDARCGKLRYTRTTHVKSCCLSALLWPRSPYDPSFFFDCSHAFFCRVGFEHCVLLEVSVRSDARRPQ